MLAATQGDKRRKKTGATYGKAIRRRGPAHLISGHNLSNDFQDVKIELPVRPVASKEPEMKQSASNKRQSPTIHTDVFDFPSDSDNEVLSPDRTKKRKLSPRILKPTSKLQVEAQLQKISAFTVKQANTTQPSPKKSQAQARQNISPSTVKPTESTLVGTVQRAPANIVEQSPSQPQLQKSRARDLTRKTTSPSTAMSKASTLGKIVPRTPPKIAKQSSDVTTNVSWIGKTWRSNSTMNMESGSHVVVECNSPQQNVADEELSQDIHESPEKSSLEVSKKGSSPRQNSSPVLTPKSAKTWKVLLGDDHETGMILSESRKEVVGKTARPPHRRLIDTLARQKERVASESGSAQSTEGFERRVSSSPLSADETDEAASFEEVSQSQRSLAGRGISSAPTTSGPRITYSRQRSMLAEQDDILSEVTVGRQVSHSLDGNSQNRRGFAPTLLRSLESNTDEEVENLQAAPAIRSVHELRQAGASKRFMDEIDDLSDRLTTPSAKPSIRRSALLELLDKVQDKVFLRNLFSSGVEQKMLATLAHEKDEVAAFLLASILLLLLDPSTTKLSINELAGLGFVSFCSRFLKTSDGIVPIAKQRKSNMSKIATAAIEECQRKLLDLPLWGDVRPRTLSPRTVVLACLALALPHAPGKQSAHTLVPATMVEELFSILDTCAARPLDIDDQNMQCNLLLLMSVLGQIYLPHSTNADQPQWGPDYLHNICSVATKLLAFGGTEMAALRRVVLSLTLNITNNNYHAVAIFATPSFMHTILRAVTIEFERLTDAVSEDERMASLDVLVLMLGIMINVVEKVDSGQTHILQGSSLEDALQIFSAHVEKSFEVWAQTS